MEPDGDLTDVPGADLISGFLSLILPVLPDCAITCSLTIHVNKIEMKMSLAVVKLVSVFMTENFVSF
jgi:hypothetical protein